MATSIFDCGVYISLFPKGLGYGWCGPCLSARCFSQPGSSVSPPELKSYIRPCKREAPCNFLDAAARLHDFRYCIAANMTRAIWPKFLTFIVLGPKNLYATMILSNLDPDDIMAHMIEAADAELMDNVSKSCDLRSQTHWGFGMGKLVQLCFRIKRLFKMVWCAPAEASIFNISDLGDVPDYIGAPIDARDLGLEFQPGVSFAPGQVHLLDDRSLHSPVNGATLRQACDVADWLAANLIKLVKADADPACGPINPKSPQFCTKCFSKDAYPDYDGNAQNDQLRSF